MTKKMKPVAELMTLSDSDVDDLTSYADGFSKVMRRLNITFQQLTEAALNHGVEQCPGCRWWCESGELIPYDSDDPDGFCGNCRIDTEKEQP